jgi:hypothetical protein
VCSSDLFYGRGAGRRPTASAVISDIADAVTLKELDRFRGYTRALADPRSTDRAAMERIVAQAKPFYYLNGGLHSTETGSPEMLMELGYRLAVSERPEIREIRERTIVLINPVSEPDGRDRVVQWFYRFLKGKTDWEAVAERGFMSPPYWGHYIFHDNNRDGIQITSKVNEAVERMYWEYVPTVVHDLHESLPLLYIMTGYGPYSEAIDPVTVAEWTQFAMHEVSQLQASGLPGVWTWGFWDGWWPGYLFSFANNHNGIGRFYETFGGGGADTGERTVPANSTSRTWFRPNPPLPRVKWRAVNGMHDDRHARAPRRQPPEDARLRGMGVDDVRPLVAENPEQRLEGERVTPGRNRAAEVRQHDQVHSLPSRALDEFAFRADGRRRIHPRTGREGPFELAGGRHGVILPVARSEINRAVRPDCRRRILQAFVCHPVVGR